MILEENKIQLPESSIEMTVAAFAHWLANTKRGLEYMSYLMKLDVIGGDHHYTYRLEDQGSDWQREIDPEKIMFLRGCIAEGECVAVSDVVIEERDIAYCEDCGSPSICLKVVTNRRRDGLVAICSNCISSDEYYSFTETCKLACSECTYRECNWNQLNPSLAYFTS